MPAIERISIEGFKSIEKIQDLELRSVNVIIGANGAGKSNFINLLSFLREVGSGRLRRYVAKSGGANKLLFFGSKVTKRIVTEIRFAGQQNGYRLHLEATELDELVPVAEDLLPLLGVEGSRLAQDIVGRMSGESIIGRGDDDPRVAEIRNHFTGWRVYHFQDTGPESPIKRTAEIDDNRYLRADASNLASVLYLLRERYQESYESIRRVVCAVAPFFDDFTLGPQEMNAGTIKLEWKHRNSDLHFGVTALSDGTLRFIALATLLLQPEKFRPSTIVIDEPELGLHPYAIGVLAGLIRSTSVSTQVIVSTQSPILLDHFEPEDVLVAERQDGATKLTRLQSDHLEEWLQRYSLGQLWEKNEIGGRPQPE